MSNDELNLRHITPAFRTFAGGDALRRFVKQLDRDGLTRAVIITVPAILEHQDAADHLRNALGDRLVGIFDGVVEHSPVPDVLAARDFLAEKQADVVVAVGGGSAVVTARAASILLAEGKDVRELCTQRAADGSLTSPKLSAPKLPQWVIPSTPTSAYAKAGAAVRDPETGDRLALFDPKIRAQGIVLDPVLAGTAPEGLVRSASLNVLSMAVEGLLSRTRDPLADALLAHALRAVKRWLPELKADPAATEPRLQLMLAALMSGQGSDSTGGGLAQALAHAVGPRSAAPNGVVEALLLPHSMRFVTDVVPDRFGLIGDVLRTVDSSAEVVVEAVEDLLAGFEVPTRLRDVSVQESALAEAADHARDDWFITAVPRVPNHEEILDLLRNAW
ncbi:iron-containing alcohol dehydrogenase family protein [Corynebacterium glyciniphilum]|uniref:iron-containing alcohol dehydrogenase family protein n=1 Tax=Corynebacterium glyciniphilum TaxID=1404244 RepID=UPI003DA084D4